MSNLLNLAQSTQESADPGIGFLVIVVWAAMASAYAIGRRRLYTLPRLPEGPADPPTPLLAGGVVIAITMYLAVLSLGMYLMGLTSDAVKTPEGMRKATLFTPFAQLLAAGAVIALLWPYLPRALQWASRPRFARKAIGFYLLAIPWVLLASLLVQWIVHAFSLHAKEQHILFEIWSGDQPGVTPFKIVAIFSAVVAAPVVEELVFRALAQRLLYRVTGSPVFAIVLASLAFTATHSPWTTQPPVFVLSLFLGWLYFRSGTILAPMLMHAIFNGVMFTLFLLTSGSPAVPTP